MLFAAYFRDTARSGSDRTGVASRSSRTFCATRSAGEDVMDTTSSIPAAWSLAVSFSRSRIWSQQGWQPIPSWKNRSTLLPR